MSNKIMNTSSSSAKTKSNHKMKSNLLLRNAINVGIASLIGLSAFSIHAADYTRTEKELRIMSKIFETSLSEAKISRNKNSFPHSGNSSDATYLANQGMVFTFEFNRSRFDMGEDWASFGQGIGQLVGTITAEIAQSFSEIDVQPTITDDDWEGNVEAYEIYQEAMESLREDQRDQRKEVRDLQRSIRDIERQARREEIDTKKLETVKTKLKKKMDVLSTKIKQYENSRKKYEQMKIEKFKINNQKRADVITTTLCDYGATLRSLKTNEYVTLIFKNYENDKDQVHVFSYKSVKNCSTKDKLLKTAISYQL